MARDVRTLAICTDGEELVALTFAPGKAFLLSISILTMDGSAEGSLRPLIRSFPQSAGPGEVDERPACPASAKALGKREATPHAHLPHIPEGAPPSPDLPPPPPVCWGVEQFR